MLINLMTLLLAQETLKLEPHRADTVFAKFAYLQCKEHRLGCPKLVQFGIESTTIQCESGSVLTTETKKTLENDTPNINQEYGLALKELNF